MADSPYAVICDAGSTGTRLYVYNRNESSNDNSANEISFAGGPRTDLPLDVRIRVGNKIEPGLSEQEPSSVVEYLLPSLLEASNMVPPQYRAQTPLIVYATGGMRMLPRRRRLELFDALVDGLSRPNTAVPFWIRRENFRTIDGSDEGYYAALAVNYLAGRLGSDLRLRQPTSGATFDHLDATGASILGALDLGGASAQIVFYAPESPQKSSNRGDRTDHSSLSPSSGGPVQRKDFYSESLLGYGAGPVRDMLDAYVEASAGKRGELTTVSNPCYFRGYQRERNNVTHTGSGDGTKCMQLLDGILSKKVDDTRNQGGHPLGARHPRGDFYATTMYYYTIDFVRSVLAELIRAVDTAPADREEYARVQRLLAPSHPSLESLRAAATVACGWRYDLLQRHSEAYSELTSPEQMPRRCLGLSHVVVLLHRLGFFREENRVHFVNEIRNHTAEWTLGTFLHVTNDIGQDEGGSGVALRASQQGPPSTAVTPMTWLLLLAAGFVVLAARYQSSMRTRFCRPRRSDASRG